MVRALFAQQKKKTLDVIFMPEVLATNDGLKCGDGMLGRKAKVHAADV